MRDRPDDAGAKTLVSSRKTGLPVILVAGFFHFNPLFSPETFP
jgi:hypothetical protein